MANDINKEDPHYKGEFGSIYEVNRKFPTGGVAGDFVVIDGWAHYWNADRETWCVNAERDSYWDELMTNISNKQKSIKEQLGKKADAEQVNNSLLNLEKKIGDRVVVEGDVTNLPDEEDITSVNNKLKFKDREVDTVNFQSKGYIILRKNLVETNGVVKNVLTQDMVNEENTIYRINYDYDILENINLKNGSFIKFDTVKLLHFHNNAILHFTDVNQFSRLNKNLLYKLLVGNNKVTLSAGYYLVQNNKTNITLSIKSTNINIPQGMSIVYLDSESSVYINLSTPIFIFRLEEIDDNNEVNADFLSDANGIPFSVKKEFYHSTETNQKILKNKIYSSSTLNIYDNTIAVIDVVKYGIRNDGTDITEKLINLINSITINHYTLYFRAGRYLISKPINVKDAYIVGDSINNIDITNLKGFWNNVGKISESDNGNNFTIIHYAGEEGTTLFTGTGRNYISNIILHSNSYNIVSTYGGSNSNKEEATMTENILVENVSCLSKFQNINNIAILGFSGIGIDNGGYSIIKNLFAINVNTVISTLQDNSISNLRVGRCKTIASFSSLTQISNVRGDSIIGPCFKVYNKGSIITNILIDYNIKPVIYMGDKSDITIYNNVNRNGTNTWNNSIDNPNNSVTTEDSFIYVPKEASKVSISFVGSIRNSRPTDLRTDNTNNLYPNLLGVDGNCYCVSLLAHFIGGINDYSIPSIKRFIQISETGNIENLQFSSNIFANSIYAKNVNHNTALSNHGTTQQRPNLDSTNEGFEYYDSTLKKKILWNGTKWVNIDGTEL